MVANQVWYLPCKAQQLSLFYSTVQRSILIIYNTEKLIKMYHYHMHTYKTACFGESYAHPDIHLEHSTILENASAKTQKPKYRTENLHCRFWKWQYFAHFEAYSAAVFSILQFLFSNEKGTVKCWIQVMRNKVGTVLMTLCTELDRYLVSNEGTARNMFSFQGRLRSKAGWQPKIFTLFLDL